MKAAAVSMGLLLFAHPAFAEPTIQQLPNAVAQQWIAAAKSQRNADGATILQALEHARQMRPDKFQFGKFAVGYNTMNGKPDAVMVETWIGSKRLPDDANTIMLPVKREGDKVRVAIPRASGLFLDGLRGGQDALVAAIDEQYKDVCVNGQTHAKLC